ncbi:MAG: 30S ribosomal protein S20 [Chlamydiae bacterium]|nr:30S ribosomal protein S20 [Chlamydiota bacterium]
MAEKKPKGPQKRPSALKRDMQAETRRLRNRSRKAEIFTERKKLEAAPAEKKSSQLSNVVRLLDKAAKKGTIHPNKASRLKSRLAVRTNKALAK